MNHCLGMTTAVVFVMCFMGKVFGDQYLIDDSFGISRRFDGIGGLSGGSATSKLLIAYPDKQRDEILDILFKPNFAASLQILKVEIGGDAQASDATEASHMHTKWDENYNRGYEWWLMKEAKKRNPDIILYGLPWAFPGWVGNGTQNPYTIRTQLAEYIYKWINGAKVEHGLDIDYIGIWNERKCDIQYVQILRQVLDKNGFTNTKIVAGDNRYDLFPSVYENTTILSNVDVLGVHYPGVVSPDKVKMTGKQLWSSEDFSSYNDETGGGCWARILNQNYVQGLMTSTIAWNLIDSFYRALPWDRDSLMTAREPWSGNYIVESPIWMSAHTTQFTEIGWHYLPHGRGVGMLNKGGSYVTLVSPDLTDMTVVIETMTRNHSVCIRPYLPPYTVVKQDVTFNLAGSFKNVKSLNMWQSVLRFGLNVTSTYFKPLTPIKVVDGTFTLTVDVDSVYTLSTVNSANHGDDGPPPKPGPFPLPYSEDFEKYPLSAEPYLLAPQQGSFDVIDVGGSHGKVMRQMVQQVPVVWCSETLLFNGSANLLGRFNWTDVKIQVDVKLGEKNSTKGVFIGVRIDDGGCNMYKANGIYFFIFPNNKIFLLSSDILGKKMITSGRAQSANATGWNTLSLSVKGNTTIGLCNGVTLFKVNVTTTPSHGFVGVGTDSYGLADFDNFHVFNATSSVHTNDTPRTVHQSKPLLFLQEHKLNHNSDKKQL